MEKENLSNRVSAPATVSAAVSEWPQWCGATAKIKRTTRGQEGDCDWERNRNNKNENENNNAKWPPKQLASFLTRQTWSQNDKMTTRMEARGSCGRTSAAGQHRAQRWPIWRADKEQEETVGPHSLPWAPNTHFAAQTDLHISFMNPLHDLHCDHEQQW